MLFGIRGAAKKIFQIRSAATIRTTPATIIRIRRRLVAACFIFSSAAFFSLSAESGLALSTAAGFALSATVGFAVSVTTGLALSAGAGFALGGSVCFFCSACGQDRLAMKT